jgi:uncharacterized protein YfkK (UPF0435 family)
MKKKLNIINVGKIHIDGKLTACSDEDHTDISIVDDGMVYFKFSLSLPGLRALYMEIGDQLRDFEALRNPR